MSDLYDKSITDVFWSPNMDYSKYLHCHACQESGLYCPKHRIEVGITLRKQEIRKILQICDHQSLQYRHAIKGLLESYDIWKTIS
jgi:Pyruvate/2-oxoacid:ferredoxin oxidoreductase delta subunit